MEPRSLTWRKARRTTENGGNCVELAAFNESIAVRDSKDPEGPKLVFRRRDFQRFTETLKEL
ncbi:DUF397 domain-containing protein [Actinomadura chibensis]|uniref:DUF397 domain-containing protein n=1 Tax=Actinomadura chibensis TaxID=392828 RepID=A0A5D0NZU7_9ACTN|nr:DUF397 domain-containing protein [Actinomadura chibensis]TYB49551.1 DUF397 domain-containing protein [Actinomadura chibensis]